MVPHFKGVSKIRGSHYKSIYIVLCSIFLPWFFPYFPIFFCKAASCSHPSPSPAPWKTPAASSTPWQPPRPRGGWPSRYRWARRTCRWGWCCRCRCREQPGQRTSCHSLTSVRHLWSLWMWILKFEGTFGWCLGGLSLVTDTCGVLSGSKKGNFFMMFGGTITTN